MWRGTTMAGIIQDEARHDPSRGFVGGYELETLSLGVDPKLFMASDLMSTPVTTVQEDASLNEALAVMRGKNVRRLPVVNRAGSLFGIITSDDLLNVIASELAMIAGLIVEQPVREGRLRK